MTIRCRDERKCGERLAATETNQNLSLRASAERLAAEGSVIVNVDSVWTNNSQIFVGYVPHLEKVFSILRQKIGRKSEDDMNDLDTNSLIREMFMSVTLDAAGSSWKGLLGELALCQQSATTNDKTMIRCDKDVDHRSNRNARYIED